MAEELGGGSNLNSRSIIIFTAIGLVVLLVVIFVFIRSCSQITKPAGPSTWPILYSNLDLKDAAEIITRLKELRITYDVRNEGRVIAVPESKVADARLGLAAKNLPKGRVGWEIFDESKLGATDFDRRIQLIRAISGELSKTISAIEAVDDARVQIVIPETRLFEATTAPVTASVMLKLKPGRKLTPEQINGIINLTANSVENLSPANVSIIDIYGNLLTGKSTVKVVERVPVEELEKMQKKEEELRKKEEELIKKEFALRKVSTKETAEMALTAEEKARLILKLKNDLEDSLALKAQKLLNEFYPPNSAIVKVNIEFSIKKDLQLQQKQKSIESKDVFDIKKITTIVLVDNKVPLTKKMKMDTYKTTQAAIGYDSTRGDQIILRAVPFRTAVLPSERIREKAKLITEQKITLPSVSGIIDAFNTIKTNLMKEGFLLTIRKTSLKYGLSPKYVIYSLSAFAAFIILLFVLRIFRMIFGGGQEEEEGYAEEEGEEIPEEEISPSTIKKIRDVAMRQPEKLAELLKVWLSE